MQEWPQDLLDVGAIEDAGWRPLPFRQFILKIHSRCNLACDYCYVYRSADQSWSKQPVRMSHDVVTQVAERIAEHVRSHHLKRIEVILHGGEPLLTGPTYLDSLSATIRSFTPSGVDLSLYIQTNGTLITEEILEVLQAHRVRVGVSLDGLPISHDSHRKHHGGRGSHAELMAGLNLLRDPRYRRLYAGVLCVIDPTTDPVATYEHLLQFGPPALDLLLPHANWSNPPRRDPTTSTPYGKWLVAVFDEWFDTSEPTTTVRLFKEIIRGIVGRPSRVESIGLTPARLVVVETDGAIELSDALKSTYEGAASTGLNIFDVPFDAALTDPGVVARQIGMDGLSETCRRCDLATICGGGFYPHRYRRGTGFLNPSVYCEDLTLLIRHVHTRMTSVLSTSGLLPPR